ncbi:MAG: thioredoxin family protein [Bacteroidota bacterium]|nr:thioredoxin family protein [Bacteroidota bacterium]
MEIKILGPGCAKCKKMFEEAQKAVNASGIPVTITKVEDIRSIMEHGVIMTPALILNGEVKIAGRIAYASDIVSWIMSAAAKEQQSS